MRRADVAGSRHSHHNLTQPPTRTMRLMICQERLEHIAMHIVFTQESGSQPQHSATTSRGMRDNGLKTSVV